MKYYVIQTKMDIVARVLHDGRPGDLLDSKNRYKKLNL